MKRMSLILVLALGYGVATPSHAGAETRHLRKIPHSRSGGSGMVMHTRIAEEGEQTSFGEDSKENDDPRAQLKEGAFSDQSVEVEGKRIPVRRKIYTSRSGGWAMAHPRVTEREE